MSRNIKFRAFVPKDKKTGKSGWVQGFNMVNYHSYYNKGLMPSIYRYDSKWEDGEYVLMQFTGLKDHLGRDIYEGDIIQTYDPIKLERGEECDYRGVVTYYESKGYYVLEDAKGNFIEMLCRVEQPEIIGNWFNNPELLESLEAQP